MIIKQIPVGPLQANCYILGCEKTNQAAVIDPGDDIPIVLRELQNHNLSVSLILNTHGHFDHTGGNSALKLKTSAPLHIHPDDAGLLTNIAEFANQFGIYCENSPAADKLINDGDILELGQLSIQVIHTPGHSPGGVCFLVEDKLFSGDTLFSGSIGRTDLPGGNFEALENSIRKKLYTLNADVNVFPGHMGLTSIGDERKFNAFVRPDNI